MIDFLWHESKTKLNSRPFLHMLYQKQAEIGKKLGKIEQEGGDGSLETIQTSKVFTHEERLATKVHFLLLEVHFKIDRVQQCATMLDFYPNDIRSTWLTPMTEGEYIAQIMELYLIHSMGLVDRVVILYDSLFNLNLPHSKRNVREIVKLLPKQDGFPLFAFSSVFDAIRQSRNDITHEYRFIDNEIIDLSIKDTLARDEYRASMPKAQKIHDELKAGYSAKIHELYQAISRNDKILTNKYLPILKVVERQYYKLLAKGN